MKNRQAFILLVASNFVKFKRFLLVNNVFQKLPDKVRQMLAGAKD